MDMTGASNDATHSQRLDIKYLLPILNRMVFATESYIG
jgi:hypothetical protein